MNIPLKHNSGYLARAVAIKINYNYLDFARRVELLYAEIMIRFS